MQLNTFILSFYLICWKGKDAVKLHLIMKFEIKNLRFQKAIRINLGCILSQYIHSLNLTAMTKHETDIHINSFYQC